MKLCCMDNCTTSLAFPVIIIKPVSHVGLWMPNSYGSNTLSITCTTPLVPKILVAIILEAVALPLPFTVAPLVKPMVTLPPFTVVGIAPFTKSEEKTRAPIT